MGQSWGSVVKKEAERYDIKITIQDPNWSTNAMSQGMNALIAEGPDVIVTQNPDTRSLARLMMEPNRTGIAVTKINMQDAVQNDAFVGLDHIAMGHEIADLAIEKCGAGTDISHKISIVQGPSLVV